MARVWFRAVQSVLPVFGRLLPEVFFTGVLAGEEPIDHLQKQILRSGEDMHPLMVRIMQIHVAEEARHISFAHEYLARKVPTLSRPRKALLSVLYPVVMRVLCDVIATPTNAFVKQYDIPKHVIKDLYWDAPESEKLLRDLFADVRTLADECRPDEPGLARPLEAPPHRRPSGPLQE